MAKTKVTTLKENQRYAYAVREITIDGEVGKWYKGKLKGRLQFTDDFHEAYLFSSNAMQKFNDRHRRMRMVQLIVTIDKNYY